MTKCEVSEFVTCINPLQAIKPMTFCAVPDEISSLSYWEARGKLRSCLISSYVVSSRSCILLGSDNVFFPKCIVFEVKLWRSSSSSACRILSLFSCCVFRLVFS